MKIMLCAFLLILLCSLSMSRKKNKTDFEAKFKDLRIESEFTLVATCKNPIDGKVGISSLSLVTCLGYDSAASKLTWAVNGNISNDIQRCSVDKTNLNCISKKDKKTSTIDLKENIDGDFCLMKCKNNSKIKGSFTIPQPIISTLPNNILTDKTFTSPNGKFNLKLEGSNLLFYVKEMKDGKEVDTTIWESKTQGKGVAPHKAILADNGNFSVVDSAGLLIWQSGVMNKGVKPYFLSVQDSGNVIIYDNILDIIWQI